MEFHLSLFHLALIIFVQANTTWNIKHYFIGCLVFLLSLARTHTSFTQSHNLIVTLIPVRTFRIRPPKTSECIKVETLHFPVLSFIVLYTFIDCDRSSNLKNKEAYFSALSFCLYLLKELNL